MLWMESEMTKIRAEAHSTAILKSVIMESSLKIKTMEEELQVKDEKIDQFRMDFL